MARPNKVLRDAALSPIRITIPHLFTPRHYQLPLLRAMDSGYRRACWVVHRRSGKTKTVINLTIKKMWERVGVYYHCFPEYNQGRKIVWDGIDNDGMPFLSHFPVDLIDGNPNDTEMKIRMTNGSIYQIVGADNYDSLVGPNPMGLIFDEWAVSDKYPMAWNYFRPILAENGGWAVFTFTPRGRNHGWSTYQTALNNPEWFCQLLTIDDTGAIGRSEIEKERADGMSDSMIQQEFYCSFLATVENILIPFEFINSALHRDSPYTLLPRMAGGDCARYGDDRSTLVIRQGASIIHAEKWKNLNNVQLAGRFIDRYRAGMYDAIGIDVIGMPGVYDLVKEARVPCIGVNVSENSPVHEERFHRLRDELWWKVREMFMDGGCSVSKGIKQEDRDGLIKDIQDVRYAYKSVSGQIVVESKKDMKKRLGWSPDFGDALCCSFAPGLESKAHRESASNRNVNHPLSMGTISVGRGGGGVEYDPLTYGIA